MSELALLIAKFGLPTIAGAVVLYILVRGEVRFRYPRPSESGKTRVTERSSPLSSNASE